MVKPGMMIRTTAKANGNSVLSRKSFRVDGFVPRTETEAPEAPRTQTKIEVDEGSLVLRGSLSLAWLVLLAPN